MTVKTEFKPIAPETFTMMFPDQYGRGVMAVTGTGFVFMVVKSGGDMPAHYWAILHSPEGHSGATLGFITKEPIHARLLKNSEYVTLTQQ